MGLLSVSAKCQFRSCIKNVGQHPAEVKSTLLINEGVIICPLSLDGG